MQFSAGQIAALLGGKLIGNPNVMVSDVAPVESAQPHHLSFITDEKYIPSDGVILDTTTFDIEEGDTAYDILTAGARVYGISIDVSSIGYVSGIGYIYELAFGQ